MAAQRLLLIRHCRASGQAPDAPLTPEGHRQALALADFLARLPVDTVATSAFTRARQSIAPFAARVQLPMQIDSRLNERTLSRERIADWRRVVRASFDDLDLCAPGGESAREVLCRAWASLHDLLNSDSQRPAVVTHGNLMSLVLHSLDPSFGYRGWQNLSNPDVYELRQTADGTHIFHRLWHASA